MPLRRITLAEARRLASRQGLTPVRVAGTDILRFSRREHPSLERVPWGEVSRILRRRGVAVYASGGWLKVLRDPPKGHVR